MTTCRFDPETLTLHCFGDLSPADARRVEEHLTSCAACAAERDRLRTTLGALDPSRLYPREAEVDWDRFADRTVARVLGEGATPKVLPFRQRARRWVAPAMLARAAAVVVATGLGALLLVQMPQWFGGAGAPAPEEPVSGVVMSEAFQDRLEISMARQTTRDYLEQSRVVLVNVLDAPIRCTKDQIDIGAERRKSIELLRKQKRLQGDLDRPELARAAELCHQLEGILTEISTLESCADLDKIRELRDAVQRNQLLVKIGVVGNALGGSSA